MNNGISYLLKYKNESEPVEFTSTVIRAYFPMLAFKYLENQLIWLHPKKLVQFSKNTGNTRIVETPNPIGDPIGIQCKCTIIFSSSKY